MNDPFSSNYNCTVVVLGRYRMWNGHEGFPLTERGRESCGWVVEEESKRARCMLRQGLMISVGKEDREHVYAFTQRRLDLLRIEVWEFGSWRRQQQSCGILVGKL